MSGRYEPPSDFLKTVIADEIPFGDNQWGRSNLRKLIDMMRDDDRANRDWATLLIAQQEIDTAEVREALLRAAVDEDEHVRAEAILGLAQRDPALALPLLRSALSGETASMAIFEAATLVADPSLIDDLRAFAISSDNSFLDELARDALEACERALAGKMR
jgi:HEAT repeat protein